MAFVRINPAYQAWLQEQGLASAEDFIGLPIMIVGGHADRHVGRILIGEGARALAVFLKREHCVRWKDRLANARAGFGFCSRSAREAQTLQALTRRGIACPEWLAVGETGRGQAFLLVRELTEVVDLRVFMRDLRSAPPRRRHRFARRLGQALAGLHSCGFDHPDIYAKHVMVQPDSGRLYWLDWQRSRRQGRVSWKQRCRDLAALDATLAPELLSVSERILCLRSYLRACRVRGQGDGGGLLPVAFAIFRRSRQLVGRHRIREMQNVPVARQQLVWLDGEALCVTPEFQRALAGEIPEWLRLARLPAQPWQVVQRSQVRLPGVGGALLVRRRVIRPLAGIWAWLRRRRLTSPELRRAREIFRLQRTGVGAEQLLAFGQRCPVPWRIESFLLTRPQYEVNAERPAVMEDSKSASRRAAA
jgi:tRNA A-37 threonylcarbamoyl transferase component Bud32